MTLPLGKVARYDITIYHNNTKIIFFYQMLRRDQSIDIFIDNEETATNSKMHYAMRKKN